MATSTPILRIVRCPKCSEILTEFSYIPIYQCGGCGTTLRAKNYNAATVGGKMEKKLQNLPHCVSLNSGLLDEKQNVESIDPRLTFLDDSRNCFDDIPELEHDQGCSEEREDDPDCKVESEVNCSSNEADKSSKVDQQCQDLSESSSSLGTAASIKNCTVGNDQDGHGNYSPSISTASRNPYDGSVSSDDNGFARNILATVGERRADQHEGKQDESQEVVSNANEMLAENKGHRRRHTTLNSEDFHSVQTWLESEDDEPLTSPGKAAPFLSSHGDFQMEILKMVDELREGISEMFDKSDESRQEGSLTKKHGSHFIRLPSNAQSEHVPCMHCYRSRTNTWNAKLCSKTRTETAKSSCDKSRNQQMKRHCRPVLGGAPFVICLNCLELLELPIDLCVATKKSHKLRCGACSKVLVFSSGARGCRTPYAVDHSVSEQWSSSDATVRHKISNSRLFDRSQSQSQSQSISYSTDIEQPHCDEEFETIKSTTPHCDRPQEECLRFGSRDGTAGRMAGDDSQSFPGHVVGSESPRRRPRGRRATSPIHQLLKSLRLKTSKHGRKLSGQ